MKQIANIITSIRIILSIIMFFLFPYPWAFFSLYIIGGLTDVLDGYIARKTNTKSEFGAKLDSIADIVLFTVILKAVFHWMGEEILKFIPILGVIVLLRLINFVIAAYKYHTFAILHTIGNKAAGFFLFFAPFFIWLQFSTGLWFLCILALWSAFEETLIHITSKELNRNRPGIFK